MGLGKTIVLGGLSAAAAVALGMDLFDAISRRRSFRIAMERLRKDPHDAAGADSLIAFLQSDPDNLDRIREYGYLKELTSMLLVAGTTMRALQFCVEHNAENRQVVVGDGRLVAALIDHMSLQNESAAGAATQCLACLVKYDGVRLVDSRDPRMVNAAQQMGLAEPVRVPVLAEDIPHHAIGAREARNHKAVDALMTLLSAGTALEETVACLAQLAQDKATLRMLISQQILNALQDDVEETAIAYRRLDSGVSLVLLLRNLAMVDAASTIPLVSKFMNVIVMQLKSPTEREKTAALHLLYVVFVQGMGGGSLSATMRQVLTARLQVLGGLRPLVYMLAGQDDQAGLLADQILQVAAEDDVCKSDLVMFIREVEPMLVQKEQARQQRRMMQMQHQQQMGGAGPMMGMGGPAGMEITPEMLQQLGLL